MLTLSAENDENKKRWDQLNEDRRKDARTIRRLKIRIEDADQECENLKARIKRMRDDLEEE